MSKSPSPAPAALPEAAQIQRPKQKAVQPSDTPGSVMQPLPESGARKRSSASPSEAIAAGNAAVATPPPENAQSRAEAKDASSSNAAAMPPPLDAPDAERIAPARGSAISAVPPPAPLNAAPAPSRRAVNSVVLGPGTPLQARLHETLSTRTHHRGQTFSAVLDEPLVVNGVTVAQRGAGVEGRIIDADPPTRFKGLGRMRVILTALNASGGQHLSIQSEPVEVRGQNILGFQSLKNGASTGAGTVVGAVAGRQAGSAVGSLVGGVIGTSGAILTGGKPAVLQADRVVTFRLSEPLTIAERASGR